MFSLTGPLFICRKDVSLYPPFINFRTPMKLPQLRKKRQGFTLIELLTVIAIIGILAGMLSVVVPLVKKKAAQLTAGNNCKQLATAYMAYSGGSTTARNISVEKGATVTNWAVFLTQKQVDINDGRLWFIEADDRLAAVEIPRQVINAATKVVDPTFQAATPKSWAVVAGAPRTADGNYPILWTRGLPSGGGEWDKTNSPWKGEGGHVAFANGSSTFVNNTNGDDDKGIFIDFNSKQQTPNLQSALGSTARIVEDK